MSLLEGIKGPLRLEPHHIDELNRMFSEAFTERYHRDGMTGVRVPQLNPAIWRYAIAAAGEGAFHWRDPTGQIAAFNLVHVSGIEGWMGPLAVRPDCQGRGVGQVVVTAGVRHLEEKACRVIGLETMPRTVENIGFYSRIGFRPGYLTISLARDVFRSEGVAGELASELGDRSEWLPASSALVDSLVPGLDFEREIRLTLDQSLGDLSVIREGGRLRAFALWHSAPLAVGRSIDELRILKLVARDRAAFRAVIQATIAAAARRNLSRVGIRCQTAFREAFGDLLALGFRVHWTDLRMVLADRAEQPPLGGVVFSNWEI